MHSQGTHAFWYDIYQVQVKYDGKSAKKEPMWQQKCIQTLFKTIRLKHVSNTQEVEIYLIHTYTHAHPKKNNVNIAKKKTSTKQNKRKHDKNGKYVCVYVQMNIFTDNLHE